MLGVFGRFVAVDVSNKPVSANKSADETSWLAASIGTTLTVESHHL